MLKRKILLRFDFHSGILADVCVGRNHIEWS